MQNCIFCEIISKDAPAHIIWENGEHLAFLSIFPNTEGVTVVIPKKHFSSYLFDQSDDVVSGIVLAAREVAKILDAKFEDVGRTGMIFEGFGVDHLHAKLFPMHGTKLPRWKKIESSVDKYFENYEGYLSSHDYIRADDDVLARLAEKLRK